MYKIYKWLKHATKGRKASQCSCWPKNRHWVPWRPVLGSVLRDALINDLEKWGIMKWQCLPMQQNYSGSWNLTVTVKSSRGSSETELVTIKQKMKFSVNKCKGMSEKVKKSRTATQFKQTMISTELATAAHQRIDRAPWKVLGESCSGLCWANRQGGGRHLLRWSTGIALVTSTETRGPSSLWVLSILTLPLIKDKGEKSEKIDPAMLLMPRDWTDQSYSAWKDLESLYRVFWRKQLESVTPCLW